MKMKDMSLTKQNEIFGDVGLWWLDDTNVTEDIGGVSQGAVQSNLDSDGYPVVIPKGNGVGGSLKDLFEGGEKVNHLFLQDTYDHDKFFEYNAFENYAYLKTEREKDEEGDYVRDFKVYKAIGTPDDGNAYFLKRGNFFPYNDIAEGQYSANRNRYDEKGNALVSGENGRYDELLYKAQGKINYNFGMEMTATFTQPVNGLVNGKHMVYEFNGDDDLWVFIDNVLVLDIGGNHDARSGYIDFSSGQVWVQTGDEQRASNTASKAGYSTTIKKMFTVAGASTADFKKDTFGDGTPHTLRMFYMERGNDDWQNASNLHIRMNIATIPAGSVDIGKSLSDMDEDMKKYAKDVEFPFQLWAQESTRTDSNGNPVYEENSPYETVPGDKGVYTKTTSNQEGSTVKWTPSVEIGGVTYKNVFYLKPDEVVRFENLLQSNQKYYVTEIGAGAKGFDQVVIRGIGQDVFDQDDNKDPNKSLPTGTAANSTTGELLVGTHPTVQFVNDCSVANKRKLFIKKQMETGQTAEAGDTFDFRVKIGGTDFVDDYYLKDADKKYCTYNGNTLSDQRSDTPVVCGKTGVNGLISGVPAGYTVEIADVLSGLEFEVQEVFRDGSGDKYQLDDIEVVEDTCESPTSSVQDRTAKGIIKIRDDAEVIVTNSFKMDYSWEMIKKSSTPVRETDDHIKDHTPVPGAEFELVKVDEDDKALTGDNAKIYFGRSEGEGIVTWYETDTFASDTSVTTFLEGRYLLTETEAPTNFLVSNEKLLVIVGAHNQVSISAVDGNSLTEERLKITSSPADANGITHVHTTLYFVNEPVYVLPDTGGIGIHWYIVSGTLMMMAGILILYKRKYAGRC